MDNLPGCAVEQPEPTLADQLAGECYDARWLSKNTPQPREWLIRPVLPAGELCAISGAPGSGKTYLAIILGLSVARGHFNGAPCKKASVMYVTREESRAEIHRRIKIQTESRRESIPDGFYLQTLEQQTHTWLHKDDSLSIFGEAVFAQAESLGVELLIFEMLPDFFAGSEIDRQQVNSFFKGVVAPRAKRAGCACLFLMHPSVAGLAEGSGRSGSTANFGSLRSVLFQRQTDAGIAIKLVKSNYAQHPQEICTLVWNDVLRGFDIGEALPPEAKKPQGGNQSQIFYALPEDGGWISQQKVRGDLNMKSDRFNDARQGLIRRSCIEVSQDGKDFRRRVDAPE